MIDPSTAQRVLQEGLTTGGDFCEIYAERGDAHIITMRNRDVENAAYTNTAGVGVRVFSGLKSAYAYTNSFDEESLLKAARAAAAAVKSSHTGETVRKFVPARYGLDVKIPFSTVDHKRRIALLDRACFVAKEYSEYVAQTNASYMDSTKEVFVCNTEGVYATDLRVRTRMSIQVTAMDGGVMQTGVESPGFLMGFEAYEKIDPEQAAKKAAATAVTMLKAPECPSAVLPVVIDGGFGGVIFHEACGHSLEATAVAKGNSEFAGKLGQKIAADCVSAYDDGTILGEWGSIAMDDEGTPSRRNLLIERGILKGFLIDRMGARRMGMPVTGNSRRQDYSFPPTSRMTNTFIAPGEDDEEEMIKSMAEGLYAKKMGGGSVNPLTGEFNFAVNEGYWVKNGEILHPVRGATLVGKGAEVLMRIDRVGKHMWFGQGVCGSKSGSVPTNVGQPRIRVSHITIGGKGGTL